MESEKKYRKINTHIQGIVKKCYIIIGVRKDKLKRPKGLGS